MSKRLQVILPDDEYRALTEIARRQGKPVAAVVRNSLRSALAQTEDPGPEERLAAILRFARFSGPTGDIEQVLEEIARGRDAE